MSAVYENDDKEVCVQLVDNDYILVMNADRSEILKIVSKDGRLQVNNYEKNTSPKEGD